MRRRHLSLVLAANLLAACSPSQPPATNAAPAAPVADARQAKALEAWRQMLQQQQWEFAAPVGKEIVDKYPGSAAAQEVQKDLADVSAKANAAITRRRLVVLFPERMKARYAHYLVYPERSTRHKGFQAFRDWLHAEADAFQASGQNEAQLQAPARAAAKRAEKARRVKR